MNDVCLKLRFVGLGGSPTPKLHSSAPLPLTGTLPFFLYPVNAVLIFVLFSTDSCCSEVAVQTKKHSEVKQETQESSTISRYSCRSLVDREPSHTAYVFAAGFDKSNNIFLGVRKPEICLYLRHRIILSHVTALKGRLLPNDNVVEHISIH